MPFNTRLLSGFIALEKKYIKPDDLLAAFRLWKFDPRHSLREILISQGQLTDVQASEVERAEREWLKGEAEVAEAEAAGSDES